MNVLSLFDGISCGQIALNRLGINCEKYLASEIEKNAIKVAKHNYPNTIHLGDVKNIKGKELPKIDLLMGGSPCQSFSLSGKQLNFDDPRGKLFFEFIRLFKETSPKYFLFENVKMKKKFQDVISEIFGAEPKTINSKLVSAQSRTRLYWTNIPDKSNLKDKNIFLKDVIENYIPSEISVEEIKRQLDKLLSTSKYSKTYKWKFDTQERILVMRPDNLKIQRIGRVGSGRHKSEIITVLTHPFVFDGKKIRKITPLEGERLQTVPENYTKLEGITGNNRLRMLGNGWTVDVIVELMRGMK